VSGCEISIQANDAIERWLRLRRGMEIQARSGETWKSEPGETSLTTRSLVGCVHVGRRKQGNPAFRELTATQTWMAAEHQSLVAQS
jgi:hypothetical protein